MPRETHLDEVQAMQRLQDKYGYVVCGARKAFAIGETVPGFYLCSSGNVDVRPDIQAVVVGYSSVEEWRMQCLEAYGHFNEASGGMDGWYFIRVRAE